MRLTLLVVYKGITYCLSDIAMAFTDAGESAPVPRNGSRYSSNGTMQRYVYPTCVALGVADHREIIGVPRESAMNNACEGDFVPTWDPAIWCSEVYGDAPLAFRSS